LGNPLGETKMKALIALALMLTWLSLGVVLTACSSDDVGGDYYENDLHGGYPGPAVRDPKSDQ
jgi:hypothetical protein